MSRKSKSVFVLCTAYPDGLSVYGIFSSPAAAVAWQKRHPTNAGVLNAEIEEYILDDPEHSPVIPQ